MNLAIEKQNKDLENTLIVVAKSSEKLSTIPVLKLGKKTVTSMLYDVLINNPYKFKQYELFEEVHYNQRKNRSLKIETYQLQRSELCSLLGWGIHGNSDGKLALVACELPLYNELLNDISIKKKNAYVKQRLNK